MRKILRHKFLDARNFEGFRRNMRKKYQKPTITYIDQNKLKFHTNPEVVYREIAGESILVPSGKMAEQFNGLASLNKTGLFLWKILEQERTFLELVRIFAEEYELTEEQSTEDVREFLSLALEKSLVLQS